MGNQKVDAYREPTRAEGTLLIVDDNPNNLRLLSEILTTAGYKVRPAKEGNLALASARLNPPELILLDIMMPQMDGFEVCRQLKAEAQTREVPVIFISALEEIVDKVKAFDVGGVDFISKPFQAEEVLARVRTHLALYRLQARLEELVEERTAEVREGREMLGAILKSVPDGLLALDLEGQVFLMNRSAEDLFGSPLEALRGHHISALFGEKSVHERIVRPLVQGGTGGSVELELLDLRRGESRLFRLTGSLVKTGEGESKGVILVLRDVTQEIESERLKGEFLSTAAHELNTPLTSVRGYAELLLNQEAVDGLSPDEQKEFLATIVSKADALARIVAELLDLSRIEAGRPLPLEKETCDLPAMIGEMVSQIISETPSRRFELALAEDGMELRVDKKKVAQALGNLLSNAVKFSDEGSLIRVSAGRQQGGYRIAVEDEGIGMTAEHAQRAFEKFYRADSSNTAAGGFGLGLTIAKNIVEAHDGRILLESEIGKGTRVVVTLPLS